MVDRVCMDGCHWWFSVSDMVMEDKVYYVGGMVNSVVVVTVCVMWTD